ncbi:hypothetical protein KBD87_02250 [Candidatus Saccharibacteria bacterium]|nr:hypothetical protein [Candidatus Saccharibacteria bacterium]
MRYSSEKKWLKKRVASAALAIAFCVPVAFAVPAAAQDDTGSTEISTLVCKDTGAEVTIASPVNDSTVNTSEVTVSGTVRSATQLVISLDGQYSQTIALASGQQSYSFGISLPRGTHAIKLVANDVCQVQDGAADVVLTYEPASTPSNGETTPTTVDTINTGIIVDANAKPVTQKLSTYEALRHTPVIGPLLDMLQAGFDYVGLDTTLEQGGLVISSLRVAFFSIGMSTLAFTTVVLNRFAMGWIVRFDKFIPSVPAVQHTYRLWILRSIGIIAVVASLFV